MRRVLSSILIVLILIAGLTLNDALRQAQDIPEVSPFDPTHICLFWDEVGLPSPLQLTQTTSYVMEVETGRIMQAKSIHPKYYTYDRVGRKYPENKLGSLTLDYGNSLFGKLLRGTIQQERLQSILGRVILQKGDTMRTIEYGSLKTYRWSPDETQFAFTVRTLTDTLLEIADQDGKILQRVSLGADLGPAYGNNFISWSSDQRHLLVALQTMNRSNSGYQDSHLLLIPVGGGPTHLYSMVRDNFTSAYESATDLSAQTYPNILWSPTGKQFAIVVNENSKTHVEVVDAETGDRVTRFEPIDRSWALWQLAWAPDEHALIVSGYLQGLSTTGRDGWIAVLNIQQGTTQQIEIPEKHGFPGNPTWTRNNKGVLFSLATEYGTLNDIYLWDEVTTKTRLILTDARPHFNLNMRFVATYSPEGDLFQVLDEQQMVYRPVGTEDYMLVWNDAATYFAFVDVEKTPTLTQDPTRQFVLSRYDVATRQTDSRVIEGTNPRIELPLKGSMWAIIHYLNAGEQAPEDTLMPGARFTMDRTALFNMQTGEFRPLGMGLLSLPMYRPEQQISTDIQGTMLERDRWYRPPYYMFTEKMPASAAQPMQKYTLFGAEGTTLATFIMPLKISLPDRTGNSQRVPSMGRDWFMVSLLAPDRKHALFTSYDEEEKLTSDGGLQVFDIARLYVGTDGEVGSLVAANRQVGGANDIVAMWSPDSRYFVVMRAVEQDSTPGVDRLFYLEIYNADGSLRWQRIYGKGYTDGGASNPWLQKCGTPYHPNWDWSPLPIQ